MPVTILEGGKKNIQQFVTKVEVDAALIQIAAKVEDSIRRYKSLFDQVNAFIVSYNDSMARLNDIHSEFAETILSLKNEVEKLKNGRSDDGK